MRRSSLGGAARWSVDREASAPPARLDGGSPAAPAFQRWSSLGGGAQPAPTAPPPRASAAGAVPGDFGRGGARGDAGFERRSVLGAGPSRGRGGYAAAEPPAPPSGESPARLAFLAPSYAGFERRSALGAGPSQDASLPRGGGAVGDVRHRAGGAREAAPLEAGRGGRPRVFQPEARGLAAEAAAIIQAQASQRSRSAYQQLYDDARRATRLCTLEQLARDDTPLALRPGNPALLGSLLETMQRALERRQPNTTRGQDRSGWKFWCQWCELMGTEPIRRDAQANLGVGEHAAREIILPAAAFLYWCMSTPYKPASMMARLRCVVRLHKQMVPPLPFVSLQLVAEVCKGVVQDYLDEHGADWIAQKRKEPVTNEMLRAWLTLPEGTRVGGVVVGETTAWQAVRVFITLMAASGFRCSDVALEPGARFNGNRHLSMHHVKWQVDGVRLVQPSPALLAAMAARQVITAVVFLFVTAPPSKADQDGTRWRASPITVRYDHTAPINLACEMARYELLRGLAPGARCDAPVLVDRDGRPWRRAGLNAFFKLLLLAIPVLVPAAEVVHYSVHSFRIYLACALLAVGASHETIKLMVRWASDEALQIYARLSVHADAGLRDAASRAVVHSVRSSTLEAVSVMPTDVAMHASATRPADVGMRENANISWGRVAVLTGPSAAGSSAAHAACGGSDEGAATAAAMRELPEWREAPDDAELARRAGLRSAATAVPDIASRERSDLPAIDLHDQVGALAAAEQQVLQAARLADRGAGGDSDSEGDE